MHFEIRLKIKIVVALAKISCGKKGAKVFIVVNPFMVRLL